MLDGTPTLRAAFTLRLRCHHCLKITARELMSPDVEDAPTDIDELLESAWLRRQTFACGQCDNPIATLVSIRQDPIDHALSGLYPTYELKVG